MKAIIIRDRRLLVIGKRDDDGPYYLLPGGGQMPGEPLRETLERECREEIAADVNVGPLLFVRDYIGRNHEFAASDSDVHQVDLMFACELAGECEVRNGHQPDTDQIGVYWLELDTLLQHRLYPMALRPHLMRLPREGAAIYLGDVN